VKFYIASGFKNKELVKKLNDDIQNLLKWELTYDWTLNESAGTVEALTRIGEKEYRAVMDSDIVIVVLPGGKGCHTELGIALGSGKKVLLYDPEQRLDNLTEATTFYFLPQVKRWNGRIEELGILAAASISR
jgi:ABC-type antimicrobial peptide transport system ATPase subunit